VSLLRGAPRGDGITGRDLRLLGLLGLPCIFLLLPAMQGRTLYWGDLTYLHHPWKALPAQLLQAGDLPLWNPFVYLGMPLAGQMQSAVWYPGSLPFFLLSFPSALLLFHLLHLWLAGTLSFLWLRSLGLDRAAAAGGGAAYMLCGLLVGHLPFLNHISTLALLPALLLLARRRVLLALALALGFLSGYPQYLAGGAAAAWGLSLLFPPAQAASGLPGFSRLSRGCLAAGAIAAALASVLLLPGLELAAASRRGGGVDPAEALTWSFRAGDFLQFAGPALTSQGQFSPLENWWKTCYWGLSGLGLATLGTAALSAAAAAAAAAYLAATAFLLLGSTTPASSWLWTHLPGLAYIRYPGNMAFLAAPVLMLLIAAALHRRRWAPLALLAITAELLSYGAFSQPTAPRGHFTESGPLVQVLRRELHAHRYLLSPLALNWQRGAGADADAASQDLRQRLYGLTNIPYRLPSAGNFGEPLVPRRSYELMDFFYSRPGLAAAAPWLGWADIGIVLTRDRKPPGELEYLGDSIWNMYRGRGPAARAFFFSEDDGTALPAQLGRPAPALARGRPLPVLRDGMGRLRITAAGGSPGWLYLAEPLGPGWKAVLLGPEGPDSPRLVPAMTAFWKMRVPRGEWTAYFTYDPLSWRLGLALTILSLLLTAAFGAMRLRLLTRGGRPA